MSSKRVSISGAVFAIGATAVGVAMVFAGLRPVEQEFSLSSYSETARTLASISEQGPLSYLEEVSSSAQANEDATIREIRIKKGRFARPNMFLVVADERGIVRADSRGANHEGKDFSAAYEQILRDSQRSSDGLAFICVYKVSKPLLYKKIGSLIYIVHAFHTNMDEQQTKCIDKES